MTGKAGSVTDVIDALQSALDAAKKAHKESLGLKAAIKFWADKAKAV